MLRRARVTVVDIDEDQIRNNDYAHEAILGDVQVHRFAPGSFDLVICYNVIEHLLDVEAALNRFCESLKQGGLMFIGAPNPNSLSGVVTTAMSAARNRPASPASRHSRPFCTRWSRFRISKPSRMPMGWR